MEYERVLKETNTSNSGNFFFLFNFYSKVYIFYINYFLFKYYPRGKNNNIMNEILFLKQIILHINIF